jgi:hypothetical protein
MWDRSQPMPKPIQLPCGGTAYFETDSGMSFRCDSCFSVVGSMGMPSRYEKLFRLQK